MSSNDSPGHADVERLAARLDQLAVGLSDRERALLLELLVRAADPLERLRLLADDNFDENQLQLLNELDQVGP